MRAVTRFDRIALIVAAVPVGAAFVEGRWPHELAGVQIPPRDGEEAAAIVDVNDAPYPARTVLDGVAQRPLFTVDRRPYEPPPAAQSSVPTGTPPPTIDAELVGIAKAADAQLILLRLGSAPTVHRLRIGGQIEGWTVTNIGRATATLSSNGHERELTLVASTTR